MGGREKEREMPMYLYEGQGTADAAAAKKLAPHVHSRRGVSSSESQTVRRVVVPDPLMPV